MKQQYQLPTGVWVIAECQACGRGFVTFTSPSGRDEYAPQGSRDSKPCKGKVEFLEPHPNNPESLPKGRRDV